MPELSVDDVDRYTGGRLPAGAEETSRLLDAALVQVRRWCGWHVTPVAQTTVTIDGPGTLDLLLPTLALRELVSLTEDGVAVDVDNLEVSGRGLVRKRSRMPWTSTYGGITVTMSHGFDICPDFDAAVLAAVDASSLISGRGDMIRKRIDDVEYQWSGVGESSTGLPTGRLAAFRLESRP
jgi:hypothetical protein